MKIKNYENAKEQIRPFLSQYLSEQGFKKSSSFRCINPSHQDKNASSGVMADGTHFHCLGCSFTGDIFDACHFIEGRPNAGPGFVVENLSYLATKFEVPVEVEAMTPEEVREMDTYRAYSRARDFLNISFTQACIKKDEEFEPILKELKRRGWDKSNIVQDLKCGWIRDVPYLVEHLEGCGFSRDFIHEIELDKSDLFNGSNLLFSIADQFGRPVGFGGRDVRWKANCDFPKYYNTSSSVSIYKKGKRLYNLHNALPSIKKGLPLYLVEGYSSVITANQNGLVNMCAIGGTSLTEDHVQLLRELGVGNIILCLDGDARGQEAIQRLLDDRFTAYPDLNIRIVILPDDKDPDDFIRESGIAAFRKLTQWSAFEWRLLRFPESEDPEQICKIMIPLIVGEISYITQERMCEALSKQTGISLKTIQSELSRLRDAKERKIATERTVILDGLSKKLNQNPHDAELLLHEAASNLQQLSERYNQDKLSPESFLKLLSDQKSLEENKTGEFAGFRLGSDLQPLEEALSGEWKKDVFLAFGGKANAGKTSLLAKMAYEIAAHIKENNPLVIFHTIDDTGAQFLGKWICIAEGSRQLTINEVRDPVYFEKHLGVTDVHVRRNAGYQKITELVRECRLVLKDANDGNSLAYAESLIKYYRERYPDRRIVYFLDNMHKLQEFGSAAGEERTKFRSISDRMKNMATRHHITVIATVEYTKLAQGIKPTNNNIAETVQIEYDSNFIAHLYNEAHERGEEEAEKLGMTHNAHFGHKIKRLPVIELIIGKNKITDFKNRLFLDFFPASSDFIARNTQEVEQLLEDKKKSEQAKPKAKPNNLFG